VEFALVVPILILIVIGIIEFGRLWMTMNTLTGAAREGVRVAAVTPPDPALVQNAVNNILTAANLTGVTIAIAGPNGASEVTVTVQMTYTTLTGTFIPGLNGLQLTRSAMMRWEG
jgi:Flp pilus assembly protein TadG